MATYYVRTDGSNSNAGTGSGTGSAWATVAHALGGTGTASGVVGGDVIYIAPGRYTGVTVGISPSSVVSVIGDPSSAQFGGAIPAGPIYITNQTNDRSTFSGSAGLIMVSKNNFSFANLVIGGISSVTSHNLTFDKCFVSGYSSVSGSSAGWTFSANTNANLTVRNCAFFWLVNRNIEISCANHSTPYTSTIRFENTYIQAYSTFAMNNASGLIFTNCNTSSIAVTGTVVAGATYQNSIINIGTLTGSAGGNFVEDYNVLNLSARSNVAAGSNSVVTSNLLNYGDYMTITGTQTMPMLSPPSTVFNQLIGYGTTTNAPATDFYGATYGTPMTVGPVKSQTLTGAGIYQPTERNASTITIAPGSTSQSIELYLGITGLTASTSGLSARYNRTRTASVSIPLVARTIAQAWTAGGFAEVDATNMPGVYRLDLPDAALAAGADDVTIVVRGASGTNGAVMTVKLSSGGLTAAQTASAVWGEDVSGYNTGLIFGGVINEIRNVVGVTEAYVLDVPNQVWDEAKSNHTIPNTFGDYLDTKVSTGSEVSRIQLRQGPFLIKQNAIESVITEVNQFLSTVPNIEMVLIDSSGGSVSVAGATLVMRVRNQAGTAVVNNVTPTVAYADGGVIRWSPNLSWNALGVTTAGTYRIVVERTMSSVTTTFGPFLVQLSSG